MIIQLRQDITSAWDPSSHRCGRLIQRFDGFWHYSVALSDSQAIAWGPVNSGWWLDDGQLVIHPITLEFIDTIEVDPKRWTKKGLVVAIG